MSRVAAVVGASIVLTGSVACAQEASGTAQVGGETTSAVLGTLKWVPPGSFDMGGPGQDSSWGDGLAAHRVTLTSGFWMMEREVTQGMWRAVMGDHANRFPECGDECPVERVSWTQAVEFAERLSSQEGVTYRLPTEAEWAYAAHGGEVHTFAGSDVATEVGWIGDNSGRRTHPSCQLARNGYGLCDMTGNVAEWTGDWMDDYPTGPVVDPSGPASAHILGGRVTRGGHWLSSSSGAHIRYRARTSSGQVQNNLGFRLVRATP